MEFQDKETDFRDGLSRVGDVGERRPVIWGESDALAGCARRHCRTRDSGTFQYDDDECECVSTHPSNQIEVTS